MKRLLKVFFLFVALLLVVQVPVSAESLQDNLVPQDGNAKSVGEVQLKYNDYPQANYKLDTWVDTNGDWMPWNWADGAGKQIYIALMEIINSIWIVNSLLGSFSMKIVQEAFQLDFVSNVCDQIGEAIQNIAGFGPGGFMVKGLWPLLVTIVIGIVGAWATYVGMVKRESTRAWGGLISSMIIFVFALGFFSNAPTILKGVNSWSSNLQSEILAVSASIVNPGSSYSEEEGIATIRNQMFDLMVKKPYLLMQYGTTKVEEGRVNELLQIDPIINAQDRSEKAKEEVQIKKNKMMSIDGVSQRAAFVPLLFIANSIIGIFLLIVSGTIILYQMIFLALVLFAPVPLLMAMVPRWQQSAFDWAMKVLHAQLMKIAIALLLTIMFGISAILYRATDNGDLGYLGMMLLQIICFVGIWAKRKDLFNVVSTAVNNVQSSTGATLQGYKQKYREAKNMVRTARNVMDHANGSGRMRNQPLARRQVGQSKIGILDKDQLAKRKKQFKSTKDGLKSAVAGAMLADRNNEEFTEGQEISKKHTGIEHTSNVDREQLMDRTQKTKQHDENGNITSIEDLRRRRLDGGNLPNVPLANRKRLRDVNMEDTATLEHSDMHNPELTDHSQGGQLSEHRSLVRSVDHGVSQDTTNRERLINNSNEKNIKDKINHQSINNDHNERTVNNVTERNNNVTETNRSIQDTITERENVSKEATRRTEQNLNQQKINKTVNRENTSKNKERE
ncbi:CD3337/EF1877 family mobilome membrane protein [Bacillus sp. EB600]|uniref:CD3337/EF1877 family mobilome membrane protein n=1 Tax=Bacillus sp. EB600 TaxID=2806345 RepID=UPI00210F02E1|nr:conjugal transfer protein [Bacillus sp. EB600]MCQ6281089.1 conjugal transfer protein [Bacillus sp. EB600]